MDGPDPNNIDYCIITTSIKLPVKFETLKNNYDFSVSSVILSFDIKKDTLHNLTEIWIYNVCKNIHKRSVKNGFLKMMSCLKKNIQLISNDHKTRYKLQLLKNNPNFEKVLKVYENAGFKIILKDFNWTYHEPREFYLMVSD